MRGALTPLPQYVSMAWCSVKRETQGKIYLYLTFRNRMVKLTAVIIDEFDTKFYAIFPPTSIRYVHEIIGGHQSRVRCNRSVDEIFCISQTVGKKMRV
jgi:hypothetical protein